MKILIIDDDLAINKVLRKVLEMEGHEVINSYDGIEGIPILNKTPDIDLVITDIVMPEKEGIETIMEIRKTNKAIKIIAISGGGRLKPDGYLLLAEKLGADAVLKKPFDGDELLETIEKIYR
ncbi:MAG: response regulator [Fidelibacterota bacterium]